MRFVPWFPIRAGGGVRCNVFLNGKPVRLVTTAGPFWIEQFIDDGSGRPWYPGGEELPTQIRLGLVKVEAIWDSE